MLQIYVHFLGNRVNNYRPDFVLLLEILLIITEPFLQEFVGFLNQNECIMITTSDIHCECVKISAILSYKWFSCCIFLTS